MTSGCTAMHVTCSWWVRRRRVRPPCERCVAVDARRATNPSMDEPHRLLAGRHVRAEEATDGRGHRRGARLAHAAHRHAEVLGLDDHHDPTRLEVPLDIVRDLTGQPLMDL